MFVLWYICFVVGNLTTTLWWYSLALQISNAKYAILRRWGYGVVYRNIIGSSFYWYYSIFNWTSSVIVSVYIEKELKLDHKIKTSIPTLLRKGLSLFLFYIFILYSNIFILSIIFKNKFDKLKLFVYNNFRKWNTKNVLPHIYVKDTTLPVKAKCSVFVYSLFFYFF